MRTVAEFGRIAADAARLWWRFLPQLAFWLCLGHAINVLAGHASTVIGADRLVLGTLVIILGIVSWVACLVLAIHSLGRGLDEVGAVPGQPRTAVLLAALGPFLAVYAAWGLAEEQFDLLVQANLATFGIDAEQFSVNASDWKFFLWFAAGAWLVRMSVRLLRTRRPSGIATALGLYADGAFIFSSFFVLRTLAGDLFDWLNQRVAWRWLQAGWDGFIAVLPEIPIWFQLTLPEGLRLLGARLWGFIVPGFGNAVLLPLMWIALTATVFGWGGYSTGELLRGTVVERHAGRLLGGDRPHPVRRLWRLATADLREKYLPMLGALRLLTHSGSRFLGGYLVLVAAITLAGDLLDRGILFLIGPQSLPVTLLYAPTQTLVTQVITMSWLLATYAAALNRAVPAARAKAADVTDEARSTAAASRT